MKFLNILVLILLFSVSANANEAADEKAKADAKKNEASSFEEYMKMVKEFEASDKFKPELLSEKLPQDFSVGNPDAKVKIVEYASLGCIHCKQFHKDVFYEVKKNYIDTGKVYFTYRHYPLNAPAIKAAVVMACVEEADKLAFMGTLFEAQAQWAYSKSEADLIDKLKTITKIAGITTDKFETCYKDEAVQGQILENMKKAYDQLFVTSTPSIFINGKRFMESREYEGVAKYIDGLLAGKTIDEVRKEADVDMKASDKPAKVGTTPAVQ